MADPTWPGRGEPHIHGGPPPPPEKQLLCFPRHDGLKTYRLLASVIQAAIEGRSSVIFCQDQKSADFYAQRLFDLTASCPELRWLIRCTVPSDTKGSQS